MEKQLVMCFCKAEQHLQPLEQQSRACCELCLASPVLPWCGQLLWGWLGTKKGRKTETTNPVGAFIMVVWLHEVLLDALLPVELELNCQQNRGCFSKAVFGWKLALAWAQFGSSPVNWWMLHWGVRRKHHQHAVFWSDWFLNGCF